MLHEVPSFWGRYRANFCHQPPWQVFYPCHLCFKLSLSFLAVFGSLYMHHYFYECFKLSRSATGVLILTNWSRKMAIHHEWTFCILQVTFFWPIFCWTPWKLRQRSVEKKAELWSLHRWHILWPIETMTLNTLTIRRGTFAVFKITFLLLNHEKK